MDLGVNLPTARTRHTSPEAIVRLAQAAERLGYGAVWTYERLLYPTADVAQPGGPPRPLPEYYKVAYDPLETLAYVAAKTERIRLGTSVVDALFHTPVVLAKRYATLDLFSGGRAIAGLGQGWMAQEFRTANVPPRRKGAGMDEFVAAMRAVWGPDPVRYRGRFYRIPESILNPKPVQPGGPPILLGAMSPAGLERAARIADGINPIAFAYEQLVALVEGFRGAARAIGRDPAALKVVVRVNNAIAPAPLPEAGRAFLSGSAAQLAADLARLLPLGIDHVFFGTGAAPTVGDEVALLEELIGAASAAGVDVAAPAGASTRG
jgi:probable F420-dependent oxidoreductase